MPYWTSTTLLFLVPLPSQVTSQGAQGLERFLLFFFLTLELSVNILSYQLWW
jgi:hypothetical protein